MASAGWTKDGKWALVYDRYDVWAVSPDGAASRKLTNGRASELQFRVVRLDTRDDEEERGIDPVKAAAVARRESGDAGYRILFAGDFECGQPQKLLMGPKNYRALGKAKDADVVMVTATTFHDRAGYSRSPIRRSGR